MHHRAPRLQILRRPAYVRRVVQAQDALSARMTARMPARLSTRVPARLSARMPDGLSERPVAPLSGHPLVPRPDRLPAPFSSDFPEPLSLPPDRLLDQYRPLVAHRRASSHT
ncbi:hypothetical protein ACFY7C_10295 [Streptomyces sp. NPDC012769]|uniref:hypothetical protein n=1 Tax=Streptomyces sp. NPDC012769 TaxID=3364848 RepID=UPI0036790E7C